MSKLSSKKEIKNLVFDLGGVIINLSPLKTYEAFSALSNKPLAVIENLAKSRDEFLKYETGHMSDANFRNFIRESMQVDVTDELIDKAWNAMLLDIPKHRLQTLLKLKERYQTFVLSNTNEIHLKGFSATVAAASNGRRLDDFVHRAYYSHQMGLRKPHRIIYDRVVEENNLDPSHTLFFDDTFHNLEGAIAAGLQTYHVTNADELFKELDSIQ